VTEIDTVTFPCASFPDDPHAQRLLGLYDMRTEGLVLQRIKVHAGRITPAQLRTCAELARTFTPGYPVHLTTRQDIELHGLRPGDVPAVQQALGKAGLTTLGAAGDTPRNVTVCPGCGLCPGKVDVSDLADRIAESAQTLPWIRRLPRKFKICISGCEDAAARPWINDVGLIACADGTFRAVLAGSLGARPGTGIELYAGLKPGEVIPLVVAALRLFEAGGDRQNRARARLRHVRERLGDKAFRELLDTLFQKEKAKGEWPVPDTPRVSGEPVKETRLRLPLGDIEPDAATALADAAEAAGAVVRIGFEHDLFIYGSIELSPELTALVGGPSIVSCPGNTWCEKGIACSRGAAAAIRERLPAGCELKICLSGCPNNCAHAAVADIGFTGRIKTIDGVRTECFRMVAGGGKGRTPILAQELHPAVPADNVGDVVAWVVEQYEQQRSSGHAAFDQFVGHSEDALTQGITALIGNGPAGS
jgi:sulfite reductase (ferredoxin)